MINNLRKSGLKIEPKHNMVGFLGVLIDCDEEKNTYTLIQTGLIERIISALELENSNGKRTPAEFDTLPANKEGKQCNENFNYSSVVGMLSYLSNHTQPSIEFLVHQCGRYSHCPRAIHETALKRIGRYLVGTKEKGLIFVTDKSPKMECYVDSDISGLWLFEDSQDPICT